MTKDFSSEIRTAILGIIVFAALLMFGMEKRSEARPNTDFVAHVNTVG